MPKEKWSEATQAVTRDVLDDLFDGVFPAGFVAMKNRDRRFGLIKNPRKPFSPSKDGIVIVDRNTDEKYTFHSVEEMIDEGWAVD